MNSIATLRRLASEIINQDLPDWSNTFIRGVSQLDESIEDIESFGTHFDRMMSKISDIEAGKL